MQRVREKRESYFFIGDNLLPVDWFPLTASIFVYYIIFCLMPNTQSFGLLWTVWY